MLFSPFQMNSENISNLIDEMIHEIDFPLLIEDKRKRNHQIYNKKRNMI